MRLNNKHTTEELERYIEKYLYEGLSYKILREKYGLLLSNSVFNERVLKYQAHGLAGIQSTIFNTSYSDKFKASVVEEHLNDGTPMRVLARKYNISSYSTVRSWVIKYTKGKDYNSYSSKPEVYKMKGRKATHEEKIQMVKDCLNNRLSYRDTAEKYNVSYNNIYSWVQKYKEYGPDGLIDGRGRRKPNSIQTDEEKLSTEIAALKARNEFLETENAALKKLKETERELMLRRQDMKQNIKRLKNSEH